MNLFQRFADVLSADPQRTLIKTLSGDIYRNADVLSFSARYAEVLRSVGLTKGDRVAVQVEKSPQALFLYLACLRAGAAYLPLNTAYKPAELEYFISDAEPRIVVCDPRAEDTIASICAQRVPAPAVLTLDAAGTGGSLNDQTPQSSDNGSCTACTDTDLAAILYTSGTTGKPKGAMLSHLNLRSNAETLTEYWGFGRNDVLLHALPLFHVHGLFVACHCTLLGGGQMLFLPRFDADAIVQHLPDCTAMMGVPTFYVRLLEHPEFDRDCCKNMRLFVAGSAPLLEETFNAFYAKTGHKILERYGMTETGMLTSNPLKGSRVPGTVGPPLPGVTLRVCDDADKELAQGEIGAIQVKGPNVFSGYWRNPEKTAEEFSADGFFKTGDVGRINEQGYVEIVGRSKDLVISGGYNVYPKEVESVLDTLNGIVESAVFGVPHADFGECVTAAVVPADVTAPPNEADIVSAAKQLLASYKVPKKIYFLSELPRNTMGKVQKNILRERYG